MLTLVDLSSVYWPAWFSTQSGIRAFDITTNQLDWLRRDCDRIVVCCDSPRLLRKEWAPSYKEKREKKPQEAIDGLTSVQARVKAWGLPVAQADGYEGEDIVATLCSQAWPEEVQIVGVDKDLYCLISDTVFMTGKNGRIDVNGCYDKWGVTPSQMRDFLALTGDATDSVEGCAGCGPERAAMLLERFGSIAAIKEATDEEILSVPGVGKKTLDNLRAWQPDMAIKMVTLLDNAPVQLDEILKGRP